MPAVYNIDNGANRYKMPINGWINRGRPDSESPIHILDIDLDLRRPRGTVRCGNGNWNVRITMDPKLATCPECLSRIAPNNAIWRA